MNYGRSWTDFATNLGACSFYPKLPFWPERFESAMTFSPSDLLAIGQIIWINILLSGDNAVVIALACRSLPDRQRRLGIALGAGAAVVLRIIFSYIVANLLSIPFLKVVGGVLLLWIAVKLVTGSNDVDGDGIKASNKLWTAVGTIAMADTVMSLDNVVAIAAIAKDNYALFIFGLALSIPLIVAGASLITAILARVPLLVWAGAGLLGWIAGDMIVEDHAALASLGLTLAPYMKTAGAVAGASLVLAMGYMLKRTSNATAS
jgi:YjbE family integral membrane protein